MKKRGTGRREKLRLCWQLFFGFFRISAVTVGGGMAMLPLVIKYAVEKRGWLSREEMVDCMAISQTLPGPVIVNNSIFIGQRVAGFAGSCSAFIGSILPSFICIIIISTFLDRISGIPQVAGFFKGALAAAAGLVAVACFRIGKDVVKRLPDWLIAIAAFVAVAFLHISVLWAIAGGCVIGLLLWLIRGWRRREGR